jgi:hypothetical protein
MNKTIKRIIALAVSFSVIAAMTACTPKEEGGNAPQLISGGTAATVAGKETDGKKEPSETAPSSNAYGLLYNGVLVTPGMEVDAAIKALGEGYVKSADIDDCDFNGKSTTYDYKSFVLFADNRDGGKFKISTIDVRDASVDCGGVKIGSSLEDVKKVYGTPTSEEIYGLVYVKEHTQIQFISTDEKTVSSILYKSI